MKTSEYLIYGTIIFLLYKLYKNTQPDLKNDNTLNKSVLKSVIDLPKFSVVTPTYWNTMQIQPTPAEVLSPEQLAFYKNNIKGISKQIYTC